MGGWDIHCAICGGPFSAFGAFDHEVEGYGYDEEVLGEHDLEWLKKVRLIGYNPGAFGVKKCFITGRGEEHGYGSLTCDSGDDPNVPLDPNGNRGEICLAAFSSFDPNVPLAVPFHEDCFILLSRTIYLSLHAKVPADLSKGESLAGLNDEALGFVSKRTLYMALKRMYHMDSTDSSLSDADYGEVSGSVMEQYWVCVRGEEAWVSSPLTSPEIKQFLTDDIQHLGSFTPIPTNTPSYDSDSSNPFTKLPKELILEILSYLPFSTLKSLALSGLLPLNLAQQNVFWHLKIKLDFPFLFDLPTLEGERNWLLVYSELHKQCFATTPEKRQDDEGNPVIIDRDTSLVLGLANRRRVWAVCEHITRVYLECFKALQIEEANQLEVAEDVKEKSLSLYTPIVGNPVGNGTAFSSYFISAWWGLKNKLELSFHFADCFLCGIEVKGLGLSGVRSWSGWEEGVVVEKGKWIKRLVLNISYASDNALRDAKVGITGLEASCVFREFGRILIRQIILNDDTNMIVGDQRGDKRFLEINRGMVITGLIGELDDGAIKRLGLLQAPNPYPTPNRLGSSIYREPEKEVPPIQKQLWHTSLPPANIHASPYQTGYWMPSRSYDTIPMSYILFSSTGTYGNLTNLRGIESDPHMRCWGVKYSDEDGKQTGPMDTIDENKCFKIDGEGWERVVKLEIGMNSLVQGVKITTNRNRIAFFGHTQKNYHMEFEETDSAFIAGLYISWGYGDARRVKECSTISILSAAKPGHSYEQGKIEGRSVREVWNPQREHPSQIGDQEYIVSVDGEEGYQGKFW